MLVFLQKITPSRFYIFAAVICEILFIWTSSPLQVPDEFNHFYRTYQISEGHFLPQQKNKRLGGDIPYDVSDFAAPFKMESVVPQFKPPRNGHSDPFPNAVSEASTFRDFPNTAYYSPVSYLPQAFILFILRQFDVSVATLYHAGRIFGFLINLLAMLCVIRIIPVYKWLFTLLALLPMNVFVVNSFSADTVTNFLSFLFIALVFKCAFDRTVIANKLLVYLCALAGLLALAKVVYAALILLVFLIPLKAFQSGRQRFVFIAGIFAITGLMAFIWSGVVMKNFLPYQEYNPSFRDAATISGLSNYEAQKAYILDNPAYFPKVIFHSVFNPDQSYLPSYIGRFGAFLDVPMPLWIIIVSYSVIFLIAFTEKNEFEFSARQCIIIFSAAFVSLALLLLSQHLTWDPVAKGRVDLIQGRYLIPLFPLVFIVAGAMFRKFQFNAGMVVAPFILFLNASAVLVLYQRYLYEPYDQVTRFTCDVEEYDAWGNYKTSVPFVFLQGCSNQTAVEKRNGKFSALVSRDCPYCFTYVFKGFRKGDILDVSLWKKGEATLCMSGGRKDCGTLYNEFDDVHYTDRNGWVNLHGILKISSACDTVDIGFFVRNKNDKTAYIDDLTFIVKKESRNP